MKDEFYKALESLIGETIKDVTAFNPEGDLCEGFSIETEKHWLEFTAITYFGETTMQITNNLKENK